MTLSEIINKKVEKAVKRIERDIQVKPAVGMILGSGLGCIVDEFKNAVTINFKDIPNFPVSTVEGHRGQIVVGEYGGINVIALSGRVHYYEGYTMQEVTFPVRVMAGLGVKSMLVTNASGGVNENFKVGEIVIIKDHINLMCSNPLIGGADFISMTNAYNKGLRKIAHESAEDLGMGMTEGVYLAMCGPSYETPAEIKMSRVLGADMVGMSTVPEVIVANSIGVKVMGLSMVTNMAAGITGEPLSHDEVIETTKMAHEKFKRFIAKILENLRGFEG